MTIQPSDEVLERFGVRLVAPLGGRLNQHWLVEARRERLGAASLGAAGRRDRLRAAPVARIAALGWPVAPAVAGPIELDGYFWSLAPFLPGDPPPEKYSVAEQRARGRLLAEFHADLAQLRGFGQRGTWRRCEAILGDPTLGRSSDRARADSDQKKSGFCAGTCAAPASGLRGLRCTNRPGIVIHGDFAPWNLRFIMGGFRASSTLSWPTGIIGSAILRWRGAASTTM